MTEVKEFRLFSEWRGRVIYGESLPDSIRRAGKLQRPDKYHADFREHTEGEWCKVASVVAHKTAEENYTSTRGGKNYETALVAFDDGRIESVNAMCEGTWKAIE